MKIHPLFATKTPPQWLEVCSRPIFLDFMAQEPQTLPRSKLLAVSDAHETLHSHFSWREDRGGDVWMSGEWKKAVFSDERIFHGDCDDFVGELLKQLLTHEDFWDCKGAFRWLMCKNAKGEGHIVLAIEFDDGTYIADNCQPHLHRIDDIVFEKYKWSKCTSPGEDLASCWHSLVVGEVT